jgi:hypothetical protein
LHHLCKTPTQKYLQHQHRNTYNQHKNPYNQPKKNLHTGVEEKERAVVNNTADKAQADKELVVTEENIRNKMTDLENLAAYNADLHAQCDFVLKNFDARQTARSEEMEALSQAKAILSGAQ